MNDKNPGELIGIIDTFFGQECSFSDHSIVVCPELARKSVQKRIFGEELLENLPSKIVYYLLY
jgi:hypothetical protein